MINVGKQYLETIKRVLHKHVNNAEIRVFGSRLNEDVKKYADLDMVIVAKEKIALKVVTRMKEELEESDIPFRVDILDWHEISNDFKKIINKNYEVLK